MSSTQTFNAMEPARSVYFLWTALAPSCVRGERRGVDAQRFVADQACLLAPFFVEIALLVWYRCVSRVLKERELTPCIL